MEKTIILQIILKLSYDEKLKVHKTLKCIKQKSNTTTQNKKEIHKQII